MRTLIFLTLLLVSSLSFGGIYYPSYELLGSLNIYENCNNSDSKQKFLNEILTFYKSIDSDLPGVSPDKKTFIVSESSSDNMKRRIEIQKDPDYHIYTSRIKVLSLNHTIDIMKGENKNTPLKVKMGNLLVLLDQHRKLSQSEFEFLYNFLGDKGSVDKKDGFLIKMTLSHIDEELIRYGLCLTK